MRTRTFLIPALLIGAAVAVAMTAGGPEIAVYTTDFKLDRCDFVANGTNGYVTLEPGAFRRYEGVNEDGEFVEVEVTVLRQTRPIQFATKGQLLFANARIVEEREWIDGELAEVSRNYLSRCRKTNNIYYFGEHVDIYEDGEIVSHDGSWEAGVQGAQPGLYMPSTFLVGSRYHQENAPGVAMDRAEHLAMGIAVAVPAGDFDDCVMLLETSTIEEDEETIKIYCPDVGLVVDEYLGLVEYR